MASLRLARGKLRRSCGTGDSSAGNGSIPGGEIQLPKEDWLNISSLCSPGEPKAEPPDLVAEISLDGLFFCAVRIPPPFAKTRLARR